MAHGGTLAPVRPLLALMAAAALVVGIAPTVAAQAGPLPEAAPTVTVTPNTGLIDEQVVAVHGESFTSASGWLHVVECPASGDREDCRWVETDLDDPPIAADGSFDTTYQVDAQYLTDDGETVDCRVAPGCVVRVTSAQTEVDVPIAFDPSAPLAPPPALSVTPSTDLVDGTRVHVELTGFRPHVYVYPFLCPSAVRSNRCASGDELLEPVATDDAGTMSEDVLLRAINTSGRGSTFDCRDEDCHLIVTEDQGPNNSVTARVAFDPDAPLAPDPTIAVTPSTDLVDGQSVVVTVEGLFPGEQFAVLQCAPAFEYYDGCEPGGWVDHFAPQDGRFTSTMIVRDRYPDQFGEATVDCRATPCVVALWRLVKQDDVLAVRAGIAFVPLPATPAVPTAATPAFTG